MEKMEEFKETYQEIEGIFLKKLGNAILVKLSKTDLEKWKGSVYDGELWIPNFAIFNSFFEDSTIEQIFLVKKEFLTLRKSITNKKEIQLSHRIIKRNKIIFTIIGIGIVIISIFLIYKYPIMPVDNPFQP